MGQWSFEHGSPVSCASALGYFLLPSVHAYLHHDILLSTEIKSKQCVSASSYLVRSVSVESKHFGRGFTSYAQHPPKMPL